MVLTPLALSRYPRWAVIASVAVCLMMPQLSLPFVNKWPVLNNIVVLSQLAIVGVLFTHQYLRGSSFYSAVPVGARVAIYSNTIKIVSLLWAAIYLYQDVLGVYYRVMPTIDLVKHQLNGAVIGVLIARAIMLDADEDGVLDYAWAVILPLILMLPLNYLAKIAGVEGSGYGAELREQANILSKIGINIDRTVFPFATGLNSFGFNCGMVFLVGALMYSRKYASVSLSVLAWCLMIGAFGGMLVSDTRSAILFSGVAVAVYYYSRKPAGRSYPYAWLVMFSIPFLLPVGMAILAQITEALGLTDAFSRGRSANAAEALSSARTLIWSEYFDFILRFDLTQILGYGFYGQYSSGLSKYYMAIFGGAGAGATLHNGVFQSLIDLGWVVAPVSFVLVFYAGMGHFYALKNGRESDKVVAAVLYIGCIYTWMCSSTEAIFGGYRFDIISYWVVATAYGIAAFRSRVAGAGQMQENEVA
jgi:O-Antigen ligase